METAWQISRRDDTAFPVWVMSYFNHKNTDSIKIEDFDTRPRGAECTLIHMSQEDFNCAFDAVAPVRSDYPLFGPKMQSRALQQTKRTLLDGKLVASFFPNVKISYVLGLRTPWHEIVGKNLLKKELAKSRNSHPIHFVEIVGGNHFISNAICMLKI
jgi:hypothetical protein